MPTRRLSALAVETHKRRPFDSPEQEAHLSVLRTASVLEAPFAELFRGAGLSGPTYNVLRILRGAGPGGRACHEIAEHMVTRVPDVTRLLDRLESRGLVARTREMADRRVVTARITPAGLARLAALDRSTLDLHARLLGHLTRAELRTLTGLLAKARRPPGE
ncbi:MAG: hypothetical protein HBSAPP03_13460 [Phycisphaerae bacterium]|nr:MAG: hypothetical protein HBSAPP03_13460 [Phycisphaerae bacterium]